MIAPHDYDSPHAFLIDLAEWKGDPNVSFHQLYERIKKRAILLPLFKILAKYPDYLYILYKVTNRGQSI